MAFYFKKIWCKFKLFKKLNELSYISFDIVDFMLDSIFSIFCLYYEQNDIKNHYIIDVENEPEEYGQREFAIYQNNCYKQMDELYQWYKIDRHIRQEEIDYLQSIWHEHHISWWDRSIEHKGALEYFKAPKNRYAEYLFKMLNEEENKFEQEKEDNLIKLIKLRRRLWN